MQRKDGSFAGRYADGWKPIGSWYCGLSGVAQMSIVWSRIGQIEGHRRFQGNVDQALVFLKRAHRITGKKDYLDGAVAGSVPIWGRYAMFEFPNWAAKFFSDALMCDMTGVPIPSFDKNANDTIKIP